MDNFYKVVLVRPKRSFFKSPDHWMSTLAFAVVLTTFVINDGLHDRAKELADSLDAGYRTWTDNLSLIRSDELLSYVARATSDICTAVHRSSEPCSKLMTIQDMQAVAANPEAEELQREESYFLYTVSLQNKIAYDKDLDEKRWTIAKAIALQVDYVNLQAQMDFYMKLKQMDRAKEVHKNAEWLRKALNDSRSTMEKRFAIKFDLFFDSPEMRLERVTNLYGQAVVDHVRSQYETAKRREEKWKKAGYVLYPLGLVIGLLGKFLKTDDELDVDTA